jgi:hypothetical protein
MTTTVEWATVKWVVLGQGYWGCGVDLAQAKANFRAQGGQLAAGYTKVELTDGATFAGVDQMGMLRYNGGDLDITEVKARKGA